MWERENLTLDRGTRIPALEPDCVIRGAACCDRDAIIELMDAQFGTGGEETIDAVLDDHEATEDRCVIAEVAGELVGVGVVRFVEARSYGAFMPPGMEHHRWRYPSLSRREGYIAELSGLAVRPDMRRAGIGSRLIHVRIAYAQSFDIAAVLTTAQRGPDGICHSENILRGAGFATRAEVPSFWTHDSLECIRCQAYDRAYAENRCRCSAVLMERVT